MSRSKTIIVKKIKKSSSGKHHGGMWKVAYADFVTALMAFFLLLWLLSMVSEEKRARISAYFKYFSLYESGGTSWMEKSSEIFGESGENLRKAFTGMETEIVDNEEVETMLNAIEESLKKDIAERLSDIKDQILVDIVDDGIRIQMIDKEGSLMFEKGNTKLTPKAREVLKVIGEDIKSYPNKVIIEGHTDSLPYAGSQYGNWELSTERASSARKELETNGLDPRRVTRVTGYADTDPLIKGNTEDPRNRRISITLCVPKRGTSTKKTAKPLIISSEEKQLREVSEEMGNMIDDSSIPPSGEKLKTDAHGGMYRYDGSGTNGEVQTIIRKFEWPVFRPIPQNGALMKEGEKSPAAGNQDYDSIIREGQSSLKNGRADSETKSSSGSNANKPSKDTGGSSGSKGPAVIRELSEPVITKDKLFTIIPGGG